jgi:fatty-acyl-CoA synthase
VGAFVILQPDVKMTEEEVRDFCRGKIGRFKIPKYVFFVDSYPLTESGKVQKYLLREQGNELIKERSV